MDWKKPETAADRFKVPPTWLRLHYYEALTALFRVENALRMFVYVVLKNARKGKWTDIQIKSDEGADSTIAAIAKKRLAQDERFGYLGYGINSPLMHLTSGELIRLMFADPYWPLFAEYFPAGKEIVRTKLEEIGNIRNALAHFRPIKSDDVEVVKQNANQVLSRVEDALMNVLRTYAIVPSNTPDAWYATLKQVAGQHCSISFRQSENERWIQLLLTYRCPVVGKVYIGPEYKRWPLLTLNSPNVVKHAPAIRENIIYGSESIAYIDVKLDSPLFAKSVELVFGRQTLVDVHPMVKVDLENVIAVITNETELIREDNLARGELVRTAKVAATKRGEYWLDDANELRSRPSQDDPAEYWGTKPDALRDFITGTASYPWMPVEISEGDDEVPF